MFGQEDKLIINPISKPVIAIINCYSEWSLFQAYLETGKEFKYSFYSSVTHLYEQYQEYCNFNEEGLFNMKWYFNVFPKVPSLIICLFEVNNSFEKESNDFINEITKINEIDNCVKVIMLIKYQKNTFSLQIEKKDIFDKFSQVIEKQNIWITSTFDENCLHIVKKIRACIDNLSLSYYCTYCDNLNKKIKEEDNNENKIRTLIKMGIIKITSSQTINDLLTYPFVETYKLLIKIVDHMNIYNEHDYIKFCEYRSLADWIIINMLHIKQQAGSSHDMIDKFNKHFIYFSMNSKLIQQHSFTNINTMYKLYDYYWKYIRIDSFTTILQKSKDKAIQTMYAEFLLNKVYNFIRCIKIINFSFKDISSRTSITFEGKEILLSSITQQITEIYEKAPSYVIDNKNVIGFHNEIYLIEFIQKRKLNEDNLKKQLRNELLPQIYNVLDHIRTQEFSFLKLYLNQLLIELDLLYNENEFVFFDLKQIYSKLHLTKNLINFNKIYFSILSQFNSLLLNKIQSYTDTDKNNNAMLNNKIKLINNYILLANYKTLSQEDQHIMYTYIKEVYNQDIKSLISSIQDLTVNVINNVYFINKLFNCKYRITQPLYKHSFNLIQYDLEINTEFTIDNIPLYSIELIFDNDNVNTVLMCYENEKFSFLNKEHPINFSYSVIVNKKNENVFLSKIKLLLNFPTKICLYVEFPKTNQNIIKVESDSKPMLSLICDKNVNIGKNEYYHCKMEICKRNIPLINVQGIKIEFFSIKSSDDGKNVLSSNNKPQYNNNNISYYIKDENGKVNEIKELIYELKSYDNEIENSNKNKLSFLIKHSCEGLFYLKTCLQYSVYINNNSINRNLTLFEHSFLIIFNVVNPFSYTFTLHSPYNIRYEHIPHIITYSTNELIQCKLLIKTNLQQPLTLTHINIKPHNKCSITSITQYVLSLLTTSPSIPYGDLINNTALTIKVGSDFLIPFKCIFKDKVNNVSFGEVEICWTTSLLKDFSQFVFNEWKFMFPEINVEECKYGVSCEIGKEDYENKRIPLYICIENKEEEVKKVLVSYEGEEGYYEGYRKRKLVLFPKEMKRMEVGLGHLSSGYLKIPHVKITEVKMTNNWKEKVVTVDYKPENVYIKM